MKVSAGRWVGIAVLILLSGTAQAQDISWAAGTWKGRVEGSREQDPSRVMTISLAGGAAKCGWGEGFRPNPPAAKGCTVSGTGVKLTTGRGNTVELRRSGDSLAGTVSYSGSGDGKPYNITMKKE